MTNSDLSELVAQAARGKLDLANARLDDNSYGCLPLCVIDAVFSIGARYASTKRVPVSWARSQNPSWPIERSQTEVERTVSEFIRAMSLFTDDELADGIFKNRQRTSAQNGILKSTAVREFALALQAAGIDRFDDLVDEHRLKQAEGLVRSIKGQRSGTSFDYFLILSGKDLVKADRMVCRFVATASQLPKVSPLEAKNAVIGAANILGLEFPNVSTRVLDHAIWQYESDLAKNNVGERSDCTKKKLFCKGKSRK